ncbi:M20/M25/M40 family metallo-hydrolase [Botrimarina sp.]|uniref:M20/M25/M40 family metallo-hydrolase n=1 Tax=Botrimarina sp. TaxID=2795802 RepID=UPI0032ED49C0
MSPTDLPVSDEEALDLVCRLMAIPGRGGEELGVMELIDEHLRAEGGPPLRFDDAHLRSPLGGGVGNGLLDLPGDGPRRLFAAHTDTVPVCLGSQPRVEGAVVRSADPATGLGADDRSGTAVLLTTAMALLRSGVPHPPLTLLWLVQEEGGINGARHVDVARLGAPALAFNFDGGSPAKLTIGATGGYRLWIDIHGYPSHAGIAPEKGVSAAAIAGLAIADLVENGWHGLVQKGDKTGTSNIGTIEAGVATNVVAERARLHVEARSHEPAFRQQIVASIEGAFLRAAERVQSSEGRRGEVHFDGALSYEAFRLAPDDPSLAAARAAVEALGLEPEIAIANGGLDANWLTAHGVPTVSLGTGQRNIHTVDEELDIAQFQTARRIAWRLATGA